MNGRGAIDAVIISPQGTGGIGDRIARPGFAADQARWLQEPKMVDLEQRLVEKTATVRRIEKNHIESLSAAEARQHCGDFAAYMRQPSFQSTGAGIGGDGLRRLKTGVDRQGRRGAAT